MGTMWELHDGAEQIGPVTEEHVLGLIATGLPETVLVRPAGKEKWKNVRTHAPFAMALERRSDVQAPVAPLAPAAPQPPARPPEVMTTGGATGKFLDPGANARSCLGCIAIFFIGGVMLVIYAMLNGAFR